MFQYLYPKGLAHVDCLLHRLPPSGYQISWLMGLARIKKGGGQIWGIMRASKVLCALQHSLSALLGGSGDMLPRKILRVQTCVSSALWSISHWVWQYSRDPFYYFLEQLLLKCMVCLGPGLLSFHYDYKLKAQDNLVSWDKEDMHGLKLGWARNGI